MVLKPGARPRRFTATEEFATHAMAFEWRARFPLIGSVSMRVVDRYRQGEGLLAVRLLGVPVQQRSGPELALGEAHRYLAELPWAPPAICTNDELHWCELDELTVEVSAHVGARQIRLRLRFDDDGNIVEARAERPRAEAGNAPTPWVGEFGDYASLGGVVVPRRGTVRWELADGPFTYWRGVVTSLELLS
jgi:hypothetical protein